MSWEWSSRNTRSGGRTGNAGRARIAPDLCRCHSRFGLESNVRREQEPDQPGRRRGISMLILLVSHGTRGDVQPMVALGVALKARGHVVQLVAPSNFVTWFRVAGSTFNLTASMSRLSCGSPA